MTISKYIVLTEDKKEVRFFIAGIINNDNTFTGIMHDYVGGANYQESLIYQDKWLPTDDEKGEALEWDEQVKIFNKLSPTMIEKIETNLDKYIVYDTDFFNYVPRGDKMNYLRYDGALIENMSFRVPFGLGNTSFEGGYEITELITFLEEVNVEYIGGDFSARSLHELGNGLAYYNYEGTHFRVFDSFKEAKAFIKGEPVKVIANFDTEAELDTFLENYNQGAI